MALKYHPDKGGNSEIFTKISSAYQILSDPILRSRYDKHLPVNREDLHLIPPLEIFYSCFQRWLEQYPLINILCHNDCENIIHYLNDNFNDPLVQLVLKHFYEN